MGVPIEAVNENPETYYQKWKLNYFSSYIFKNINSSNSDNNKI